MCVDPRKIAVVICSLLVWWWSHDFYSIAPLQSRLAIKNQLNICSLSGDVIISTALVQFGEDWQYEISSTFARKVVTSWFLQLWYTPEWTGNTKSFQHLLARWSTPLFVIISPLHTNCFDVLCSPGNKQRSAPLNMNGKNDEELESRTTGGYKTHQEWLC